jgi:hypothetical protein
MSGPSKRPRLLRPSEISELIFDTDSEEAGMSSDVNADGEGCEGGPGVSKPQAYSETASCHESSSSVSSSASDEEDTGESVPGQQDQQPATLQWTRPSCPQRSVVHTYTGSLRGKNDNEAFHINDGSSLLSVILLYFAEIITLLVVETNRYYYDYVDLKLGLLLNLTLLNPKCLCFWH